MKKMKMKLNNNVNKMMNSIKKKKQLRMKNTNKILQKLI